MGYFIIFYKYPVNLMVGLRGHVLDLHYVSTKGFDLSLMNLLFRYICKLEIYKFEY